MEQKTLNKQTPFLVLQEESAILSLALGLDPKETAQMLKQVYGLKKAPPEKDMYKIAEEHKDRIDSIRAEAIHREVTQFDQKIQMLLDGITQTKITGAKLHSITTALGTIYDKRALARGDATQNVSVKGAMITKNINSMSGEDLEQLLADKSGEYATEDDRAGKNLRRRRAL